MQLVLSGGRSIGRTSQLLPQSTKAPHSPNLKFYYLYFV